VTVSLAKSYGPAATGVNIYEADVASGSAAPTTFQLVKSYALGTSAVIMATATSNVTPPSNNPSSTPVLPFAGGVFSGNMSSDANTLGDGTTLGENNVLVGPHVITVVYSGDQNYLPSTSVAITVTVVDVSSTTPVILPLTPVSQHPTATPIRRSRVRGQPILLLSRLRHPAPTVNATAGAPGTTTLTISSLGGWFGSIEFSCPDLPTYTTVAPIQATPSSTLVRRGKHCCQPSGVDGYH